MGRRILALVAVVIVISGVAVVVALHGRSPAQAAADAKPPRPTVLTAVVTHGVLVNRIVFRADVADADPSAVPVPSSIGAGAAVVTLMAVTPGAMVTTGQLVASVSTRPVFLGSGLVPAFRQMQPGDQGIDVQQLQQMLDAKGVLHEPANGMYDPATSDAVLQLYKDAGVTPTLTNPTAVSDLATATKRVAQDTTTLTLPQTATSRASAIATLNSDEATLDQLRATTGTVVPLGEVAFVPHLPTKVLNTAGPLGAVIKDGSSVLSVGSGAVVAVGGVDADQRQDLKVGASVSIDADGQLAGSAATFTGSIASVAATATADPNGGASTYSTVVRLQATASALIGLNVAATVQTASTGSAVDIVPLAAVATSAAGVTSVIAVDRAGNETTVPVKVLLVTDDGIGVAPVVGSLTAGTRVVLGLSNAD